ncbi:GNAT family N-acetyltransferase [Eubacteriales bacterium OttesenSCG-928-N13]|nr:GNAT family N-acetyltransferase [Eubacteriales bacterium OttesenSCG-928-N13]
MLEIRPPQPKDADAIHRINLDSLGYDYPLDATKVRLMSILNRPNHHMLIAELDGQALGYIHATDYDTSYQDSLKNILALAVLPSAQGQGVGRALITAIEEWARQDDSTGVRLVSGFDREGAHAFYQACGYSLRKQQKNFIKYFDPKS